MSSSSDDEGDDFDATGELPGEATRRRSSTQRRTSSLPVVDDATGRGRSGSTLLGQPGPNDVGTQMRRATGRRTGQTLTRVTASVVRAGIAGLGKGALARAARRGSSQVQGGGKGRKTFNYFGSIPSTTLAQVSKGAQVTQETKLKTLKDKLNVQRARRNSLHQQLRDLSVVTEANMEDRERVIAAKNDVIARMRHKNAASRKLMETNKDNHRTKMDWAKSKYDEEVASLREKLKAADEELTLMAELIDTKDTLQTDLASEKLRHAATLDGAHRLTSELIAKAQDDSIRYATESNTAVAEREAEMRADSEMRVKAEFDTLVMEHASMTADIAERDDHIHGLLRDNVRLVKAHAEELRERDTLKETQQLMIRKLRRYLAIISAEPAHRMAEAAAHGKAAAKPPAYRRHANIHPGIMSGSAGGRAGLIPSGGTITTSIAGALDELSTYDGNDVSLDVSATVDEDCVDFESLTEVHDDLSSIDTLFTPIHSSGPPAVGSVIGPIPRGAPAMPAAAPTPPSSRPHKQKGSRRGKHRAGGFSLKEKRPLLPKAAAGNMMWP